LYPGGIPQGSEPHWPLWLTGKPRDRLAVLVPLSAEDFLCYMAFADNPDLSAFAARGGTLLVYHRWADPIVTPWQTLQYVDDVQRRMGGPPIGFRAPASAPTVQLRGAGPCVPTPSPPVADPDDST